MRREYGPEKGLSEAGMAADWATQFGRWFADAVAAGLTEPNAMVLGTADPAGRPSGRTVLLKEYDGRGFTFYTNYESRKGIETRMNPYASLVFPWFAMHRQVVVCGCVERVSRARGEAYFASRPRGAQLGAWASPQSAVLPGRAALDEALAAAERRFGAAAERAGSGQSAAGEGAGPRPAAAGTVPMPPHWGGLRVVPETVEFWQGRSDRLHDRLRYRRTGGGGWVLERLAP
jgi:pyridoxamine 5'-phosphate oxidase